MVEMDMTQTLFFDISDKKQYAHGNKYKEKIRTSI